MDNSFLNRVSKKISRIKLEVKHTFSAIRKSDAEYENLVAIPILGSDLLQKYLANFAILRKGTEECFIEHEKTMRDLDTFVAPITHKLNVLFNFEKEISFVEELNATLIILTDRVEKIEELCRQLDGRLMDLEDQQVERKVEDDIKQGWDKLRKLEQERRKEREKEEERLLADHEALVRCRAWEQHRAYEEAAKEDLRLFHKEGLVPVRNASALVNEDLSQIDLNEDDTLLKSFLDES